MPVEVVQKNFSHPVNAIKRALRQNIDPHDLIIRHDPDSSFSLDATDGLYNQLLFDLCSDRALVSLTLMGAYEPLLDLIGWENSGVNRIVENMLTYVAGEGTAAGSPVTSVVANACEPGPGVESGGCTQIYEGWERLRRCTDTRDLTDQGIKYCETQPIYDISGQRIDDDHEWDMVRMMTVMLQDLQRRVIEADTDNADNVDGLLAHIDYGYIDPTTGQPCPANDSTVIENWGAMCPDTAPQGVTINGNAVTIPNGFTLVDMIRDWVYMINRRLVHSSLAGQPRILIVMPTDFVRSFIDAWLCTVYQCCNDGSFESAGLQANIDADAREADRRRLRRMFGAGGILDVDFDGVPALIVPYDFGLYDTGTQTGTILGLVTDVGNQPILRFHAKDFTNIIGRVPSASENGEMMRTMRITDNNRVLAYDLWAHTCFRTCEEFQWRLYDRAPWLQMKITGVTADNVFGITQYSDPTKADYYLTQNQMNLSKYPVSGQNQAPTISPLGDVTNAEGDARSIQIYATDPNGDGLTYSASGLPSGITIDTNTGLISGTIDAGENTSSPFTVTVSASDGTFTVSTSFTWTVTA